MAIVSVGYEGTVDYADWAVLTSHLGAQYSVFGPESFAVSAGPGDREVRVAPGRAAGQGILDDSDSIVSLSAGPVASGNRWDLVSLRRDWAAKASTLVLTPGTSAIALPAGRQIGAGQTDDHPIALVRFAAGQTAVQEVIDLRVWQGDGGVVAKDPLVRGFLNRIGTRLWIQGVTWVLGFGADGLATWSSDNPAAVPPLFRGRILRSDGALSLNAGDTYFRWQSTEANTISGSETLSGPQGTVLRLPAGLYFVTATLKVSVAGQNWSRMIVNVSGEGQVVAGDDTEQQTPGQFYELTATRIVHSTGNALVNIRAASNNAGAIREAGVVRAVKL